MALVGWIGTASVEPDPDRSFWLSSMGINKKGKILSYEEMVRPYFPWGMMVSGLACIGFGLFLVKR